MCLYNFKTQSFDNLHYKNLSISLLAIAPIISPSATNQYFLATPIYLVVMHFEKFVACVRTTQNWKHNRRVLENFPINQAKDLRFI